MRMLDEGLAQNSNDANPKSIPRILEDRAEEFKGQVSWLSQVANRLPGTVGIDILHRTRWAIFRGKAYTVTMSREYPLVN